MAIPAVVLGLGKQILAKAFMAKVSKEVAKMTEETATDETYEIVTVVEDAVSKKKVSGWVTVVIALTYFASAQGYIDPAIAELVNTILSNPEVVEGIESAVD